MTTYYVDQTTGDDADTGLTEALAWKTIAKVNGVTLAADDQVLFKCGEVWREQLTVPNSGTAGHPITFGSYGTGDLPKIYGSTAVATWTDEGSNIWYATCAADPMSVWFVLTTGVIVWGEKQAAKVDVTAEYEWWWDDPNDRLYVYAASDPDSRYTSIEKPTRTYCIYGSAKDYITIRYLECLFVDPTGSDGNGAIFFELSESPIAEYCSVHHVGVLAAVPEGNGIAFYSTNAGIARYNTIYHCARRAIIVTLNDAGYTADDSIIEHNTIYNIYHCGINVFRVNVAGSIDGTIIRYNYIYLDSDHDQGYSGDLIKSAIIVGGPAVGDYRTTNTSIYYNKTVNFYKDSAIKVLRRCDIVALYNNVTYGTMTGAVNAAGIHIVNDLNTNITIKNNIGVDCSVGGSGSGCLVVEQIADIIACDNNCWYKSDGGTEIYAYIAGVAYHYNDFAAYKLATGWDTHGLWEDPKFVDVATYDFHLLSTSPCINTGADVGLTEDFEGNPIE